MSRMKDIVEKKVLIIGKHSYIGRNFVSHCKQMQRDTKECFLMDSISGKSGEYKTTSFEDYDVVLLLSGIVHVKAEERLYDEVNHKMAVEIAQKAKAAGVKHFVLLSTIAVYGDEIRVSHGEVIRNPKTAYAKSKQLAEEEIRRLESDTFHVAIIQPPMVYGMGCPGNFGRLVKLIRKVHVFPNYKNERSAIHITNLCEFLRQILLGCYAGTYVPQNKEYFETSKVADALKRKGNRVLKISGFSMLIRGSFHMIKPVKKMFGDYRYPLELSRYDSISYQILSFEESLDLSIE